MKCLFVVVLSGLFLTTPTARAESVEGTVHTVSIKDQKVVLIGASGRKPGELSPFPIKETTRFEEEVGLKRVLLPNGLKDLRPGDVVSLDVSNLKGVTYVLRTKKASEKK